MVKMSLGRSNSAGASERSPLLRARPNPSNTYANEAGRDTEVEQHDTHTSNPEIAVAEEPGTAKLLAIMLSTWIGTFFAALGTFTLLNPPTRSTLLRQG